MVRRMVDSCFREEQWGHRHDDHIAPINRLVDEIREEPGRGWAPYVAPMYGGINARLLSVLRDPGPMTQVNGGSGFLCMENDDATAEAICNFFDAAGIKADDIVPWNAYPWYINRKPTAVELNAGVAPLTRILDLLPKLRVVMLHGGAAHSAWKRLIRRHPNLVAIRGLHIIETYHTSRQAFWHPDPEVRETRRTHLRESFNEANQQLRTSHT